MSIVRNCLKKLFVLSPLRTQIFRSLASQTTTTDLSNKTKLENNEPVKFFGSRAALWQAKTTRSGGADDVLWYQPYIVSLSLTVFLIYFCILREESDIDLELEKNLFDRVPGLEETQLVVSYKYNKEHGLEVSDIENRMVELGVAVPEK